MHKKLKWNAIGLLRKSQILHDAIQEQKINTPPSHTKSHKKLQGFLDELLNLLKTMERIQSELVPKLERIFRLKFKTPEIIMIALCRPSIRNIYEKIKIHFKKETDSPLKDEDFLEFASLGDAAEVLALIGDSALDLAIVQLFWDSTLTKVGKLTTLRANIVSNENLAKVCDHWRLFDYRLKQLNDQSESKAKLETLYHEKGTIVETLYGVIYLEFGFEDLLRILPLLQ